MHDANPERVRSALSHLSPHDRKVWVRQAMAIKSEFGEDGFDIWDEWASQADTHNANDARSVWRSVKPTGKTTIGTLFWDAKQAGWKDDATYKRPSAAELEKRRQLRAQRDAEAAAQEAAMHEAVAEKARALWAAAQPCETHPYLERKGVKSHGLRYGDFEIERVDEETGEVTHVTMKALLVPLMDRTKNIWSLQAISAKAGGPKLLLKNGRKSGNFFVIGTPQQVDGRRVFVLAEGYATGASVHEATGHMVVVCIDSGNLRNVARQLRQRDPAAIIVVAADNDIWGRRPDGTPYNPGMEAAKVVADEVGALVVEPPFFEGDASGKDARGNPTGPKDWNDWHGINGPETMAEIFEAVLHAAPDADQPEAQPAPEPAPAAVPAEQPQQPAVPSIPKDDEPSHDSVDCSGHFAVLGYDGDDYWVFHHAKRQVVRRGRGDFGSDQGLVELAPINWWEDYFPGDKGGVDRTRAFEWFVGLAHARGSYDPRRVRGRGAWRDNGRVVFHHGDRLSVDGKDTPIGGMPSKWVYPMSKSMPPLSEAPASDADGQHLLNVAKMARWTRPGSAALLAGWVFLSPVCGALSWRPHIWITGAAGSGKSTLFESYAQALLNGISEPLAGDSTEPGIRQSVRADAVPILIDEFEPNDEADRKRMKAVLTTARQSSSETSAQTAKGTISGDGMRFHVRSMFCFASINTMLDKDSDASRITPLVLRPAAKSGSSDDQWLKLADELHKIQRDTTWPARLLARSLGMLPTILANIDVFCRVAAQRFGTQRMGDQYGTLLAGAWSLTQSAVATDADALAMIDSYDWSEHKDAGDGLDDPQKALASVMEARIRVGTTDVTVYELLAELAGRAVGSGQALGAGLCEDILRRNGIRIEGADALFGTSSKSLKKLVDDTPYAPDLRGQLRRLPGSHVCNNETRKFAGVTSKVVAIPLSLILGDDEPPI